jgi:hypothetical protein
MTKMTKVKVCCRFNKMGHNTYFIIEYGCSQNLDMVIEKDGAWRHNNFRHFAILVHFSSFIPQVQYHIREAQK